MQVYLSIDMEGIAGVATRDQVVRGGHGYRLAQSLMTAEANAAIEGAFAAGATGVLVNDSHGTMDNLLQEQLDPRARLVLGSPKLDCMAEGITAAHDVAFFLGYHAAAGSPGVLAHTFSSHLIEVRLGGSPVSEAEVNALQAAAVGVPVGLLTGDDVICRLAREVLPGVTAVEVKQARGVHAAISLSPSEARELIREAAAESVANLAALRPVAVPGVLDVEVDMPLVAAAENGSMMPGVERVADRTLRAVCARPRDVVGFVTVCAQLAESALRARSLSG
jgi:D-amino peptidase